MADENKQPNSPQAAPSSPAPSGPAPGVAPTTVTASPTTAAERAAQEINNGRPAKRSFEEIEAEMNGAPAPKPQQNSATAPTGDGVTAGVESAPQPNQPPSAPPPVAAQGQPSPEMVRLQADIAARDELLRQYATQAQAAPQPTQPAKPEVDDLMAMHTYNVPAEVLQGLRSEDPAQAGQALNAYTGMVARTVHRAARKELDDKINVLIQQTLPRMVQQFFQHQTETKAVYEDFYNTHKDLNKPELYPTITNIALGMLKRGYTQWDARFRDDLAGEVRRVLGVGAQPQRAPVAAQPAMMTPGARPGASAPKPEDVLANEIMSLKGF